MRESRQSRRPNLVERLADEVLEAVGCRLPGYATIIRGDRDWDDSTGYAKPLVNKAVDVIQSLRLESRVRVSEQARKYLYASQIQLTPEGLGMRSEPLSTWEGISNEAVMWVIKMALWRGSFDFQRA
jgi:hypothetical protein